LKDIIDNPSLTFLRVPAGNARVPDRHGKPGSPHRYGGDIEQVHHRSRLLRCRAPIAVASALPQPDTPLRAIQDHAPYLHPAVLQTNTAEPLSHFAAGA
jgi:hypothetical protein